MSRDFATILQGLMDNRHLSARAVSRASARAESTINQLLSGRIPPKAEILQDIAPVLQISLDDLLVIAGVETPPSEDRPTPYQASAEIGQLVANASLLTADQVGQLVDMARALRVGSAD